MDDWNETTIDGLRSVLEAHAGWIQLPTKPIAGETHFVEVEKASFLALLPFLEDAKNLRIRYFIRPDDGHIAVNWD